MVSSSRIVCIPFSVTCTNFSTTLSLSFVAIYLSTHLSTFYIIYIIYTIYNSYYKGYYCMENMNRIDCSHAIYFLLKPQLHSFKYGCGDLPFSRPNPPYILQNTCRVVCVCPSDYRHTRRARKTVAAANGTDLTPSTQPLEVSDSKPFVSDGRRFGDAPYPRRPGT